MAASLAPDRERTRESAVEGNDPADAGFRQFTIPRSSPFSIA
jgi:hypothetical protein